MAATLTAEGLAERADFIAGLKALGWSDRAVAEIFAEDGTRRFLNACFQHFAELEQF